MTGSKGRPFWPASGTLHPDKEGSHATRQICDRARSDRSRDERCAGATRSNRTTRTERTCCTRGFDAARGVLSVTGRHFNCFVPRVFLCHHGTAGHQLHGRGSQRSGCQRSDAGHVSADARHRRNQQDWIDVNAGRSGSTGTRRRARAQRPRRRRRAGPAGQIGPAGPVVRLVLQVQQVRPVRRPRWPNRSAGPAGVPGPVGLTGGPARQDRKDYRVCKAFRPGGTRRSPRTRRPARRDRSSRSKR